MVIIPLYILMLKESNKMSNKINDNKLDEVTGGSGGEATRKIGKYTFTGHVGKYNATVGNVYFITEDGTDQWWMGVLLKTWEDKYCLFFTKRKHRFNVMLYCGNPHFYDIDFEGDHVTLYTQCIGL